MGRNRSPDRQGVRRRGGCGLRISYGCGPHGAAWSSFTSWVISKGRAFKTKPSKKSLFAKPLERCLAEFGWEEKRALQGRQIDARYHGVAVACFIEGGGAGPKETARLDLEADGTVSVYVGSTAVGQGLETVMAQIAADTLGLPLGQVCVMHGSTPLLDEGYGAFASRSTVLGGSAAAAAA